jgi:cell division septal protein FtsQ
MVDIFTKYSRIKEAKRSKKKQKEAKRSKKKQKEAKRSKKKQKEAKRSNQYVFIPFLYVFTLVFFLYFVIFTPQPV